jgi:hypothetical protein
VIALLIRLRAQTDDVRPFAERLRAHAGEIGSPQRRPAPDADGRNLRLHLFHTDKGDTWEIPLPPYFHASAHAAAAAR